MDRDIATPDESAGQERIYLSDVEPHSAAPLDCASDLRARVLLHVLFADTLLIGDSQSLNNRWFRALVSPVEAEQVRRHDCGEVLSDLAQLLREGRIRLACRSGSTPRQIRDEHLARGVENVPSLEYVAELEGMTAAHIEPYDGVTVAAAFKAGVLRRIEEGLARAQGEARAVLEAALGWAADRDLLLYKAIRDWRDDYRARHPLASADVVLTLESLDEWAGESYRRALPDALAVGLASPRDVPDTLPQQRSRLLLEQAELPAAMLDNLLLSRLPVEVVLEALEQPARKALVAELARLRGGTEPDGPTLRAAVGEFSNWMSETLERTFENVGGVARDHLRGQARLMRFGLEEDPLTGRLGAGIEVPTAAADGVVSLAMHVVSPSATGLEVEDGRQRRVVRRPVQELDSYDRLVA